MRICGTSALVLITGIAAGLVDMTAQQIAVTEVVDTAKVVRLSAALDAVLAPGVKIEKVAKGFDFTEGPMWHQGALWFSDLQGNKMYSLSHDGKLRLMLDKAGGLDSFPAGAYGG